MLAARHDDDVMIYNNIHLKFVKDFFKYLYLND